MQRLFLFKFPIELYNSKFEVNWEQGLIAKKNVYEISDN